MTKVQNKLRELSAAVRRKPGMYFGTPNLAIPSMFNALTDALLSTARDKRFGSIFNNMFPAEKRIADPSTGFIWPPWKNSEWTGCSPTTPNKPPPPERRVIPR